MVRLINVVLASIFILITSNTFAHSKGYLKLNVKDKVQIEIPEDWTINDAENRKRVRDLAQELTGLEVNHVASLSISSFPSPSRMWVRVSFIRLDPPLSQPDVTKLLRTGETEFLKGLREGWQEEAPAMWAALGRQGVREVGSASVAIEQLGGKTAFVIRYGRTSFGDVTQTVKVAQYHVVLGAEKALITLSYQDGDSQILAAHNRIKNSIAIR